MIRELSRLPHTDASRYLNYLLIPVSVFDINEKDAKRFNKILFWLKKQELEPIIRTKSGAICNIKRRGPAWDIRRTRNCVEITAILEGYAWRLQFRTKLQKGLSGRKAFTKFKRILKEKGIDLESYAIENGPAIKEQIEKPLIGASHKAYYHKVFEHANHIDFHSSYAAGLANSHPEFRETLNMIYERRKDNEEYKAILNFSIGFMQSINGCKAKFAHLSKDAIYDNNERIRKLAAKLDKLGRIVIAYNTDGIWYSGKPYHGEGEGSGLGEWHNDHIDCKFRMKSDGAYEFIENGIYNPVIRGISNEVKDGWKWGDIYTEKADLKLFTFSEEEGVMLNGREC